MSRFTPVDLSLYPITDVLDVLSVEQYLGRDRDELTRLWDLQREIDPTLPALDTILLESDPSSKILQVGSYREALLRAHVNDRTRAVMLAGALGPALDHIGITYYRTPRRVVVPATGTEPAVMETDEVYRQRLALAPESWSTAGPEGAYLFWALSASGEVLDVAAWSEDEAAAAAPHVRIVLLSTEGDGTASPDLCQTVQDALRRSDIRPLGDLVTVESAEWLDYDVSVKLTLKGGAMAERIANEARARILAYCSGRLRWIGDDIDGPAWLVGRTIRQDTIAAAAIGSDANVLEVEVLAPAADVNAPHPGYRTALTYVGLPAFAVPPPSLIAHLFRAPRVGSVTVTYEIASGGWS